MMFENAPDTVTPPTDAEMAFLASVAVLAPVPPLVMGITVFAVNASVVVNTLEPIAPYPQTLNIRLEPLLRSCVAVTIIQAPDAVSIPARPVTWRKKLVPGSELNNGGGLTQFAEFTLISAPF